MTKLKIRNEKEEGETLEFFFERVGERVKVRSTDGSAEMTEFTIKPDKSWEKCTSGHLEDKEG